MSHNALSEAQLTIAVKPDGSVGLLRSDAMER